MATDLSTSTKKVLLPPFAPAFSPKMFVEERECPYFVTFVNIFAFFQLVPFRFVKNLQTGKYVLKEHSSCKQIFPALLHLSVFLICHFWLLCILSANISFSEVTIAKIFHLVSQLMTVSVVTLLQFIVWRRQLALEQFVNVMSTPSSKIADKKAQFWVRISFIRRRNATFSIAFMIFTSISHAFVLGNENGGHFVELGLKPIFSYFRISSPSTLLPELVPEAVLHLLAKGIFISYLLSVNLGAVTLLNLVLTFLYLVKMDFCPGLDKSYGNIEKMMGHYQRMKEATALTESLFGNYILVYYVSFLGFFPQLPLAMRTASASGVVPVVFLLQYVILQAGSFGIAAKAHSTVEKHLRNYISAQHHNSHKKREWDERLQLIALSQEMEAEPIGLSGWFFVVNRNFISSTFGLIITYNIIVMQMPDNN